MTKTNEQLVKESAKEIQGNLEKNINFVNNIIIGIVIVLLLTVGGFIQSYLAGRTVTYQSLVDKVNEQNVKINLLYNSLDRSNLELEQTNSDLIKLKTYFGIK